VVAGIDVKNGKVTASRYFLVIIFKLVALEFGKLANEVKKVGESEAAN
jgi:hypothetical protein